MTSHMIGREQILFTYRVGTPTLLPEFYRNGQTTSNTQHAKRRQSDVKVVDL
jgi:hypothetical protein